MNEADFEKLLKQKPPRELTMRERLDGTEKQDPRNSQQRMVDRVDRRVVDTSRDVRPNGKKVLTAGQKLLAGGQQSKPYSREDHAAELDRRELAKRTIAEAQAEFDSDPKRQEAKQAAQQIFEQVKFDVSDSYTVADVERTQELLDLSSVGDLSEFSKRADEWHALQDDRKQQANAAIDAQIAELDSQRHELQGAKE